MRTWTVKELIDKLSSMPLDYRVILTDADTYWNIPKFEIHEIKLEEDSSYKELSGQHICSIYPCEYGEMF